MQEFIKQAVQTLGISEETASSATGGRLLGGVPELQSLLDR